VCPICLATLAALVTGAISTGGAVALVVKKAFFVAKTATVPKY